MSIDLDTRLQGAARSLHHTTDDLEPTRPPRDRRPLHIGIVAILVVIAIAAFALLPDRSDEGSVATSLDRVPRLIPDALPDGLAPVAAYELPQDLDRMLGAVSVERITVYGDPDADDPFAERDLGVATTTFQAPPDEESGDAAEGADTGTTATDGNADEGAASASDEGLPEGTSRTAVTVRGRPGDLYEDDDALTLAWSETDTLTVVVGSRTLGREDLLAVAEALTIDGDTAVLEAPPDGLEEIGTMPASVMSEQGIRLPAEEAAATVVYESEDGGSGMTLALSAGGDDEMAIRRWDLEASEPVQIDGRAGWVGSAATLYDANGNRTGESTTLLWEYAPGVLAAVDAYGLSEDELWAAVESLRPATDAEWRDLLAAAEGDGAQGSDEGGIKASLHGEYSGGKWDVDLMDDGSVCNVVRDADGEGGDRGCSSPADGAVLYDPGEEPIGLHGALPTGVTDLRFTGAQPTQDVHRTAAPEGQVLWVAVFDGGSMPTGIDFLADDGTVVASLPIPQ